jgi:hypothetical protein
MVYRTSPHVFPLNHLIGLKKTDRENEVELRELPTEPSMLKKAFDWFMKGEEIFFPDYAKEVSERIRLFRKNMRLASHFDPQEFRRADYHVKARQADPSAYSKWAKKITSEIPTSIDAYRFPLSDVRSCIGFALRLDDMLPFIEKNEFVEIVKARFPDRNISEVEALAVALEGFHFCREGRKREGDSLIEHLRSRFPDSEDKISEWTQQIKAVFLQARFIQLHKFDEFAVKSLSNMMGIEDVSRDGCEKLEKAEPVSPPTLKGVLYTRQECIRSTLNYIQNSPWNTASLQRYLEKNFPERRSDAVALTMAITAMHFVVIDTQDKDKILNYLQNEFPKIDKGDPIFNASTALALSYKEQFSESLKTGNCWQLVESAISNFLEQVPCATKTV